MSEKQKNGISKFMSILSKADIFLSGCALVFLVLLTFIGVIMRRVFNSPIMWQEEMQVFCILWLVFLGAGAVFRTIDHVSIEILVDMFNKKIQLIISILVYAVVMVTLVYTLIRSSVLVEQLFDTERLTNILKIPYGVLYVALPIGCITMIISDTITTAKRIIIEPYKIRKNRKEVVE